MKDPDPDDQPWKDYFVFLQDGTLAIWRLKEKDRRFSMWWESPTSTQPGNKINVMCPC